MLPSTGPSAPEGHLLYTCSSSLCYYDRHVASKKPLLVQDVAQTPVAESIDLASMPIEDSYDGPHLEGILSRRKLRFCQILHDKDHF